MHDLTYHRTMARITIIGGYGKVAMRLARILSQEGHEVTSWIRSSAQSFYVRETGAKPIIVNVEPLAAESMSVLLKGEDAVVWSAGAGGASPSRTRAVDQDAAIRSMEAARLAGLARYVMVSWFYSRPDHGVPSDIPFHHYAQAKAAADSRLQETELDWTILGPSRLTDEPGTGMIGVGGERGQVSRDDVAEVAAGVLSRPETIRKIIDFNNGTTPIGEALDSI